MPQFDFGHFYKFIVSAGLVLVATAFVVPWIVFQSTGLLTIPKSELDGFTDTAKALIIERQSGLSDFQDWAFPGLPLALGTVGLGVIVLGLISWHKRQTKQNALDDLDFETKRAAFEEATQLEVDAKLRDEATEEFQSEAAAAPASEPAPGDPASDGERGASTQTPPGELAPSRPASGPGPTRVTSMMDRMRDWETSLFERLELAYTGATRPRRNVRMTTDDGRMYILDALLSPKGESEWGQLAIELKAVSTSNNIASRLRDAVTRIAAVAVNLKPGLVYTGLPGRPPRTTTTAVVILICQDFEAGQRVRSSAEATVSELNSIMQVGVGVIVISAESFENADAITLRELITQAWSGRGDGRLVWHL